MGCDANSQPHLVGNNRSISVRGLGLARNLLPASIRSTSHVCVCVCVCVLAQAHTESALGLEIEPETFFRSMA